MLTLEFFPLPFLGGLAALAIGAALVALKTRKWAAAAGLALFGLYLWIVVGLTLFPIPLGVQERQLPGAILAKINWIPYHYLCLIRYFPHYAWVELGGNILLTLPFGFGLPFLAPPKSRFYFLWMLVPGLAIELSQLALSLVIGAAYRSVDINDVMLNGLGALLGFGLFWGFRFIWSRDRFRRRPGNQ